MRASRVKKNEVDRIRTIADLMAVTAQVYGNLAAVRIRKRDVEMAVSYEQLWNDVSHAAEYFQKQGWRRKHIALLGTLDYDWLVVFLAVVSSGNVAVPIDRQAGDIAEKLCMAEVTAVYLDRTVKQQASFAEELTGKEVFGSGAAARRGWKVRREPGPAAELLWIPQREDEAVLIFTSGTTGKSKGVLLTHQNIIDNTKCGLYFLEDGLGEGDNTIPILPPTHMLELTVGILTAFYYGAALCFGGSLKYIAKQMQHFQPRVLVMVPMIVENLYEKVVNQVRQQGAEEKLNRLIRLSNGLRRVGIDLRKVLFRKIRAAFGGRLETIICGGAALNPEVIRGLDDIGIAVYEGYGITECGPVLSCNRRGQREIGSVGVKGPDEYCQIAVIEGEICVRGSIVFQGYYRDQAATDEVKRDGWFHTGDLGRMDENGFLFLTGRKKNLIILSDGNNVSPEEIEGHFAGIDLIQSMFVREKQVNGRPCIVASIYPNYELPGLSEEELRERIRDKVRQVNGQLPAYQRIGHVEFYTSDFEKTALGKIQRYKYA